MWLTLPGFGTLIVLSILVASAYTFAQAVRANGGNPRLLQSARLGAYATSALILCGVLLLAYGFSIHDFRVRYISRYSDRSMSPWYLISALWGGQDGSLLWWTFLLGGYTAAVTRWLKGRYRQLQPVIIATLMLIIGFFAVLMIFAANPFEQNLAGSPADGDGLNPLLQNYWMIIHPPMLYMGFVGCSVPFAFCMAALVTGRLDREWIVAVRKWMLVAFLFLSIGNVLGMIWAYEELGWGGFWAWDPVENAACLPWFTASAYVHSTIIQERRNMLKTWNVVLICTTFLLTIFGTFLTRSGVIASVHSFAKSDIGVYFLVFLGIALGACVGLLIWRYPLLRKKAEIESLASREAMFVINNWALLGMAAFVTIATVFPKISELILDQEITVGPPFFNKWAAPIGLVIFAMMGLAPLFGWRRTSKASLLKAAAFPGGVALTVLILHIIFGASLGYPPIVRPENVAIGIGSEIYATFSSAFPAITIMLAVFNICVIIQEFIRGVNARIQASKKTDEEENLGTALVQLIAKNRRRYGGYIVHLGIAGMFIGFVGTAWTINDEVSLDPGESHQMGSIKLTYRGTRMCPGNPACSAEEQSVQGRRMLFADLDVYQNDQKIAELSPAKFIYMKPPQTSSEVGLLRGPMRDIYTVLATADPKTKRATFSLYINPFVSWIWTGLAILICGCFVSLWPEVKGQKHSAWVYMRAGAAAMTGIITTFYLAFSLSQPFGKSFEVSSFQQDQWGGDMSHNKLPKDFDH